MAGRVNYWGLVVAGVGFFLTRFTVTLALYEEPIRFYLAGVVPLVLGLGLAAFGVALTVADLDPAMVRTTALWCVTGVASMLALVALTLLGSAPGGMPSVDAVRSQTYLSNFLLGGSVGGTLTGLFAARNRRQRDELRGQTRRLEVLNRVLRHEVLNAVNVIQGYAAADRTASPDAGEIIARHSRAIERSIEEVKYLTRTAEAGNGSDAAVDLRERLAASVETVRERYPDAEITVVDGPTDTGATTKGSAAGTEKRSAAGTGKGSSAGTGKGSAERTDGGTGAGATLSVVANDRLETVFTHLLENAVVHSRADSPAVEVSVDATATAASVSVTDHGPGLPERQRELLETGRIEEFDDPGSGFGLNVVRLLVESFAGTIETSVEDGETTITVALARESSRDVGLEPSRSALTGVRPSIPHLAVILGASLIAGVAFGAVSTHLGASVAGVGGFYGAASPVVGWITHQFHSVVFGFAFGGLVAIAPPRYRNDAVAYAGIGIAWGLALWVVAASVVAPVWLRLLGTPVPIPSFAGWSLAAHLAWGLSLGALTAWGYRYVTPWLDRRAVAAGLRTD